MDRKVFCLGLLRLAVKLALLSQPVYRATSLVNEVLYPMYLSFLCLCLCRFFAFALPATGKMGTALAHVRS